MTTHKSFEVEFKALTDDTGKDTGRFKARVSVFGNVDVQGDRVLKGAFADSLAKWKASGDLIPVIWSHDWGNPFAHIGSIDPSKAVETDDGLEVEGDIDLTNAFAAQVHNLMKRRMVKEFSFGYKTVKERQANDGANNLEVLDLIEIGPTLKGANPDTELLGVKAELEAAANPTALTELQEAFAALKAEFASLKNTAPVAEASEGETKVEEAETPKAEESLSDVAEARARLEAALLGAVDKES